MKQPKSNKAMCRAAFLLALSWVMPVLAQQPAEPEADGQPGESTSKETLVVRDLAIWVSDAFGGRLNGRGIYDSTLPRFIRTRRQADAEADNTKTSPVGVITFEGEVGAYLDVLLEIEDGTLLGGWPAKPRRNRLLFADLEMLSAPEHAPMMSEMHWFAPMRNAPRLAAKSGNVADRFLVYDAEFDHPNDLKLVKRDDGYGAIYFGQSTVHDVTIYKPVEGGWRVGTAGTIMGKNPEAEAEKASESEAGDSMEPTPVDAEPEPVVNEALQPGPKFTLKGNGQPFGTFSATFEIDALQPRPSVKLIDCDNRMFKELVTRVLVVSMNQFSYDQPLDPENPGPAYEQVAQYVKSQIPMNGDECELIWDKVEKAPEWNDEDGMAAGIVMSDEVLDQDAAVADWAGRLAELGMGETEINLALTVLKDAALDPKQMTAVYRLDPADEDEMLPIEVTPAPSRISRVALVILMNASPDIAGQVDQLVIQLGDPSWKMREAAQKRLVEIGPGAKKALQQALNHPDVEIEFRAEQILETINNPTSR